jgi:hypothetical protein
MKMSKSQAKNLYSFYPHTFFKFESVGVRKYLSRQYLEKGVGVYYFFFWFFQKVGFGFVKIRD